MSVDTDFSSPYVQYYPYTYPTMYKKLSSTKDDSFLYMVEF
ncbi:hypothetical protein [Paraliobacillus ryukyuensis]|nr:hypothetical protein [Paraliobacillus ryukyuensis]